MAAAAIFKNRKITISRRGLTDVDKIWHSDAVRPFLSRPTVENTKKLEIHDSGDRRLEKSKYRQISAMVGPIAMKFGTMAQFDPRDHSVSKIGSSSCTF